MAASLPHDLVLFRLLPRLPTKSVFRFMCVAKEWHSFLSSDIFKRIHIHHIDDQQNHKNLIVLSTTTTPCTFSTIDCETPDNGLTPRRPLPSFEAGPHIVRILTSFHGLVCVGLEKHNPSQEYSDLILWNPFTSEYKKLSKKNSHAECYKTNGRAFGLYYNSSEDDYKLLRVTHDFHAYIYSLKSDSWRKPRSMISSSQCDPNLSSQCDPDLVRDDWRLSTCLNEYLYFLHDIWQYARVYTMRSNSVIRFDTKSETFKKIATPSLEKDRNRNTEYSTMMVIRGSIHFCVRSEIHTNDFKESCIRLWKLNGDSKWEKVVTYQPKQCNFCFLKPLHLMRNGKWLLVDSFTPSNLFTECRDYLYKVDRKNKKYSKGKDDFHYEEVRYIQTLVSPNQYVE